MTPFSILRLDPLPDHSINGTQRGWALEMHLSTSNTFVASKNVRRYLAQRGVRAALGSDDVQAIMSYPGDVYYFDGSISLLNIT
ncbi:MAG TPA: hypothetical protein VFP95_03960, partial [Gammaproteobacteria bacterium]|nr:hypothetical protein [Gammaproteobacteria bacterium]